MLVVCAASALADDKRPGLTLLEAVTHAIAHSPDVDLARQTIDYQHAQVLKEMGEHDPTLALEVTFDRDDEPLTPYYQSIYQKEAEDTQTLTTTLTASQTLENDITLASEISLERQKDNLLDFPPDNYATVIIEGTLPLAKLWHKGFGPQPKASQFSLQASIQDLAATVSESTQTTAVAFWEALAQKQILSLYQEAEAYARDFLERMSIMVDKNEYPAANLARIQAEVGAKAIQTISQQHAYSTARQTLALDMGAPVESLDLLPELDGAFPEPRDSSADLHKLIAHARDNRSDLAAERLRADYYRTLVQEAEEDLLPDVDLSLQAGYTGLEETDKAWGYIRPIVNNIPGLSYEIGLTYTKTLGQRSASSALQQARINLKKELITIASLERRMTSEVLTAQREHRVSLEALARQRDVTRLYQSYLDKETIKFHHQMADLSELIDAHDNYRQAQVDLIKRKQAYAAALIHLRQACGALVEQVDGQFRVQARDLASPVIGDSSP